MHAIQSNPLAVPNSSTNTSDVWICLLTHAALATMVKTIQLIYEKQNKNAFEKEIFRWRESNRNDSEDLPEEPQESTITIAESRVRKAIVEKETPTAIFYKEPDTIISPPILNLCDLKLRRLPPLPKENQIKRINASGNPLSCPPSIKYFPSVVYLSLSSCQLKTPPNISNLPNLQFLDLSHNEMTAIPEVDAESHPGLVMILKGNKIADLPEHIEERPKTHTIVIKRNPLTDSTVEKIIDLVTKQKKGPMWDIVRMDSGKNLCLLDLRNENISEPPKWVGTFGGDFSIDLRKNPLTKETRKQFKDWQQIKQYHDPNRPEILYDMPVKKDSLLFMKSGPGSEKR